MKHRVLLVIVNSSVTSLEYSPCDSKIVEI
jgi:hypothetical protein